MGVLFKMERRQEVQGSIGKNAYNILLAEARDGLLKKESLKLMAMEMNGHVHGMFVEKVDTNDPEHVLMYMLDVWWEKELHKGGIDALAEKIKSTKSKLSSLPDQTGQEPNESHNSITTGNAVFSRNSNTVSNNSNNKTNNNSNSRTGNRTTCAII